MSSAAELAYAVREERRSFDDALLEYLQGHHPDRLDESFFWIVTIAISYANMGNWEKELAISDDENVTVRQFIDMFGLGPFLQE